MAGQQPLFRLRIAYAKQGAGRYLSHLEVQRALTRMVRRADLPYAVSQGFNPQMRLATGPALSVGTSGEREYCDLIVRNYVKPADALRQLQEAQSSYLPVLDLGYVGLKEKALNAAIVAQEICVTMDNAPAGLNQQVLQAGLSALRARDSLEIEHKGKMKVYDSATHVPKDIKVVNEGSAVLMTLIMRISNQGSLRPDALLHALWHACGLDESLPIGNGNDVGLLRMDRMALYVEDEEGNLKTPL